MMSAVSLTFSNKLALSSLLLPQRMQIAHQALESVLQHVRVDLRRRNVGVAEERLHHARISTVVQEMACESMAEHMRAHLAGAQPRRLGKLLELAREVLAREMAAFAERREQPFRLRVLPGLCHRGAIVRH